MPTGSSKPTKTGKTVLELQEKLPKARVVYCSATGEMLVLIMVVMMVVGSVLGVLDGEECGNVMWYGVMVKLGVVDAVRCL